MDAVSGRMPTRVTIIDGGDEYPFVLHANGRTVPLTVALLTSRVSRRLQWYGQRITALEQRLAACADVDGAFELTDHMVEAEDRLFLCAIPDLTPELLATLGTAERAQLGAALTEQFRRSHEAVTVTYEYREKGSIHGSDTTDVATARRHHHERPGR